MDDQKVKIIKILTVSAVIFMALLLTALVINLVTLAQRVSEERRLIKELDRLNEIILLNEEEISYKDTDDYIEKYVRDFHNMKRQDEEVFIGKKSD